MKVKIAITLLVTAIFIVACGQSKAPTPTPDANGSEQLEKPWELVADLPEVELRFVPVPTEKLLEGKAEEGWILLDSVNLIDVDPTFEAVVHLFEVRPKDSNEPTGEIYAFLEDATAIYDIGVVGSYGIDDVRVTVEDRFFKGRKTIEIVGGKGATYEEMKVIGFNESVNEWVKLLVMGSPFKADIDGNGEEELIAESAGTIPGYIEIYQWTGDYFEKADITENAYSNFASLYSQDGQWLIETGTFQNGEVVEKRIYKYNDGILIKQE